MTPARAREDQEVSPQAHSPLIAMRMWNDQWCPVTREQGNLHTVDNGWCSRMCRREPGYLIMRLGSGTGPEEKNKL